MRSYCHWVNDGRDGKILVDLRVDDGRYYNHSHSPNIGLGSSAAALTAVKASGQKMAVSPGSLYTLRDIQAGEELFVNYHLYAEEPEWYIKLLASKGYDPLLLEQVCVQNGLPPPPLIFLGDLAS